jgi:hypothetical protein
MPKSVLPAPGFKRMNINLETRLHDAFKAATAAVGTNMTDVLVKFIAQYVQEHLPGGWPQRRSRK